VIILAMGCLSLICVFRVPSIVIKSDAFSIYGFSKTFFSN